MHLYIKSLLVHISYSKYLSSLLSDKECDITQLAAICGESEFNAYTVPDREISPGASKVTGITVEDGILCVDGKPVDTISLKEVFTTFIAYLRSFPAPVVLVAHNGKRFDVPVLRRLLQQSSMEDEFLKVVSGFLDTLLLSKDLFPDLERHTQGFLVKHFLEKTFDAHNAANDARVLQELFYFWKLDRETIQRFIEKE